MGGAAENVVFRDVDGTNVREGAGGHGTRQQRAERRSEQRPFEVELDFLEDLRAVQTVEIIGVENGAWFAHVERRDG